MSNMQPMSKDDKMEKILWSIALPGFGQLLNGHLLKGILLIFLEFIINIKSNLNQAIISSFLWNTELASNQTDYQWLMFYPCIYTFAIWDAYKNSAGVKPSYSFLPFVFAAYLGTIGVIYSSIFRIGGILLGPILLPIISLITGALLGHLIKVIITKSN